MIRLPAGTVCGVLEYSKKAGLTKQAVYKAIRDGRLKAYNVSGVWLIPADALIVNRQITHGRYIGISNLLKGNIEGFLKKRGIEPK